MKAGTCKKMGKALLIAAGILVVLALGVVLINIALRESTGVPEQNTTPQKPEICFAEIPWGSTSAEIADILENKHSAGVFLQEHSNMKALDDLINPFPQMQDMVFNGGNSVGVVDMKVEGFRIRQAELYCAYGFDNGNVDMRTDYFYGAGCILDVTNNEGVYLRLKERFTQRYGEGEESTQEKTETITFINEKRDGTCEYTMGSYDYTVTQTTWYGGNDTFLTIQWVSSEYSDEELRAECCVSIAYGKTTIQQRLEYLRTALGR